MADSKSTGTIVERIRAIWTVVELLIEETVVAAEGFTSLTSGEEKKKYVKGTIIDFLRSLEAKEDFLPSYAEVAAFKAIEFALDFAVDRIFAQLDKAGKVNVAPVTTQAVAA